MKHQLGLKSWATGALVLAAVSACGGTASDPPPTMTSSSAPSTDPTASSPSDKASADAVALLHRYFAVIDQVSQDPTSDVKVLSTVAARTELSAEERFLHGEHQRGEKQIGSTKVDQLKVQAVNLDASDPAAGKVPTVVIDACWDVSAVDVVDKDGKSIVSASRPDTGWTRYTVTNYQFARQPTDGWRVAIAQDTGEAPCTPS